MWESQTIQQFVSQPIEEVAKRASTDVKQKVQEGSSLPMTEWTFDYVDNPDRVSIGNMAYTSLYHHDSSLREAALEKFCFYKDEVDRIPDWGVPEWVHHLDSYAALVFLVLMTGVLGLLIKRAF